MALDCLMFCCHWRFHDGLVRQTLCVARLAAIDAFIRGVATVSSGVTVTALFLGTDSADEGKR